jgi:hypothetical protein
MFLAHQVLAQEPTPTPTATPEATPVTVEEAEAIHRYRIEAAVYFIMGLLTAGAFLGKVRP